MRISHPIHPLIKSLRLIPGVVLFCACAINMQAATIYVTNLTQKISSTGGCSLPEAIYSSALHTNQAPDPANPGSFITTQAGVGDGDDTIVLPAGAVLLMSNIIDDAQNPAGPTATPVINSKVTIEANGARIEHAANGKNFRAFVVNPGKSLTIRNAYIKGFTVKGGDGAEGGGGGLGAGGAIYVREAILTVDGCTFEGNGAAGGNGSHNSDQIRGGGGGGLGGNGGFAGGGSTGGGGGGGGGSRGNGADGEEGTAPNGRGGGGGGTISNGVNFFGGFDCGADGGGAHAENIINGDDGDDADTGCSGGGGGGGQCEGNTSFSFTTGSGGGGSYGGGGGGGGAVADFGGDGGDAGFGGGGGSAETFGSNLDGFGPNGGNGGFGAGGGAGAGGFISGGPGSGGSFAGNATIVDGGGGAGLGGAIFNDGGTIKVYNSTFFNNFVVRGLRGDGGLGASDAGGAIFSRNGSLEVYNSTIASNQSTGSDAGIFVYEDGDDTHFKLYNTIIANNGTNECHCEGSVTRDGSGNLIIQNTGCPGVVTNVDPQLGPLQINYPGTTPTMAITTSSPAFDAGDDANCQDFDQRRIQRPQFAHCDIGAYELAENLPPVAKCKSVIVSAGPNCTAAASIDDGSFDYDAGDHITLTQDPPGPYSLGPTTVTLTVADNHGGTSTCSSVVTVLDQTPPSITCPASITRGSDPGQCGAIVNFAFPTASDNCGDFHIGCSPASGSFFSQGTTPVVCTANDAAGNTNSCAFNVTVSQAAVCGITVSGNSGGATTVCPGNAVVLTAPNGMKHYFWSGPEQNGSTLQTIVVSTPGTYHCTQEQWYGSTNCCSVTVANYPPPPCNITGNLLITNGLPTTLVGPAGMLTQYWTGPQNNGLFSRSNTVVLAGTYVLHLTTSNGCQGACTVTVTNKTPVPCSITASGDAGGLTICSGRKTTLTAANGMTSYLWSGPEQNGATTKFINVGTQGTYTVRQIDYLGLTNSCSVFLVVNQLPVVNIFGVRTICQGSNTTLYGPDGMKTYLWLGPQHNGLGTQSNTVSLAGTYTLQITDNNGCQNALSVPVATVPCP